MVADNKRQRNESEEPDEGGLLVEARELRDQYRELERQFRTERQQDIAHLEAAVAALKQIHFDSMLNEIATMAFPLLPDGMVFLGFDYFRLMLETKLQATISGVTGLFLQGRDVSFCIREWAAGHLSAGELIDLERKLANAWKYEHKFTMDGSTPLTIEIEKRLQPIREERQRTIVLRRREAVDAEEIVIRNEGGQ